jgi:FlaA1/EpsC-like NDP-sugar epimerase
MNLLIKSFIKFTNDSIIFFISFLVSLIIRFEKLEFIFKSDYLQLILFFYIGFLMIFIIKKTNLELNRSFNIMTIKFHFINSIYLFLILLILFIVSKIVFETNIIFPRSFLILFPMINFFLILLNRYIVSLLFGKKKIKLKNIVVHGSGTNIIEKFNLSSQYNILFFIDDDLKNLNRQINNIKIYNRDFLIKNHKNYKIDEFIIYLDEYNISKYKDIIDFLSKFNIKILTFGSPKEINKDGFNNFIPRKPNIMEILDKKIVNIDNSLSLKNKTIFISGGGGSIGSEIVFQLLNQNPFKIIILEMNEFNLYNIQNSITDKLNQITYKTEFEFILGNACDDKLISNIFQKYSPNLVFHASAYKHVHISENNIIETFKNNILSTKNLATNSVTFKVENFILISSDKAVNPSNIMGSSKRIAELLVLLFSKLNSNETKFSAVRFGNVINSSGSVIPFFDSQISKGGPITLTHKEIERYFMTISEAASLVIKSVNLTKSGDIFILNMGEPIKIYDLAEKMIKMNGLSI